MDKRAAKANRRRPPNLALKIPPPPPLDPQANRENENVTVIQPSVPVFASVHRPRHASISAIKRDNPSVVVQAGQQQLHPDLVHHQQRQRIALCPVGNDRESANTFEIRNTIAEKIDNGNSNVSSRGSSRTVDVAGKQSWHQGIRHHFNHQYHHHIPIAVAIPQPFHHHQHRQNQQSVATTNGAVASAPTATTAGINTDGNLPSALVSTLPLTSHQLQQQQQPSMPGGSGGHSRIPMAAQQQNFNQISKTATNLLNDIYEKHLLNQTTFENATLLNNRPGNGFVVLPMTKTSATNASLAAAAAVAAITSGTAGTATTTIHGHSGGRDSNLNNLQHQHHQYHQFRQLQQKQHQQQLVFTRVHRNSTGGLVVSVKPHQQQQPTGPSSNHFNYPQSHHHLQQQHHHQQHHHQQQHHHHPHHLPPNGLRASQQHLYEVIDPPPPPAPSSSSVLIPNRLSRKRIVARAQRSGRSSSGEETSKQTVSTRKHVANNDENHSGPLFSTVHQQKGLMHPTTTYNHQTRTRADGEHYPEDVASASISNGGRSATDPLPPVQQPSLLRVASSPPSVAPRTSSHCLLEESTASAVTAATTTIATTAERLTNSNPVEGMPSKNTQPSATTSVPAAAAALSIRESCGAADGDISPSRFVDYFQEFEDDGTGTKTNSTAKYQYRNSKIDLMLETAQAVAAAEYYAKAAQKFAQSGTSKNRATEMPNSNSRSGGGGSNSGFCGALQRAPPAVPASLARRFTNKENYGLGRVKVILRVSDSPEDEEATDSSTRPPHFMTVDKKKRQVTLIDPAASTAVASTSQERSPMVAAPKMFAFDGLFTNEESQGDVCTSALSEVIPAVLEGSDGCVLIIGYPNSGQSRTMLGTVSASNDLGVIPCAISWLYKGINERRQKSGARFSVRVSALGVSATRPDSASKDLLAAHATESDESPGVYLREDFLGGPTELRAPNAERAALFLDAALAGRLPQNGLEPAMIFTLHVYQYSLSRKGGVAGGRSRLHLIDLGGCANRNGGLPLSGIGNILLAILSGQRHPPNKDHPLTPLLKDCLAPLTCHVTILAHVSYLQSHTDALTTIQLASRIHRMRRRKHRFPMSADRTFGLNAAHQSGGSSEGPDPSSSDLSADTVIYMGPCDDATDGEHPPVYLPSLSSGDNRCAMSKVLKGSCMDKMLKSPAKKASTVTKPQSPIAVQRADSLKRANPSTSSTPSTSAVDQLFANAPQKPTSSTSASPKLVSGVMRHPGVNKSSNVPTPKSSPLRRPSGGAAAVSASNPESPLRQISEEQWIDGPRVSRSKVAEARHLLREINHVKQCETWIDGPKSADQKSLTAANLPGNVQQSSGYGFMDSHKKTMIREWVENQSSHVMQSLSSPSTSQQLQQAQQQHQQLQQQLRTITYQLSQITKQKSEDDQQSIGSHAEMVNPIGAGLTNVLNSTNSAVESSIRSGLHRQLGKDETDVHSERSGLSAQTAQNSHQDGLDLPEEEDQDSGPSEVPPALPLIEPLGSREISHESLHRIISRHVSRESLSLNSHNVHTMDCGLQVTEEEIAKTMGCEHPLAALSHGDMSVVSSFHNGDAFSDCAFGDRTRNQFDQLARLREIFTSQLAMAEVTPAFRMNDTISVYSEPAFRFNAGPGSVCSEPPYRPPSPRHSLHPSRTPSQTSLPSLNGIMQIAGMEQYASLRHPDGASDPNLPKLEKDIAHHDKIDDDDEVNEKSELLAKLPTIPSTANETTIVSQIQIPQLPLLPLTTSEAYDSGHDSSTPRTSKHSGISRRAESGYHSVATARDSDESSFTSAMSKEHNRITLKKKRQDKSLCNWLRNPFTCAYPETEGEVSDF